MTSRGFLKQQFAWRHFYWVLTNEGVEYLREYLHLPAEIVPVTMKKQAKIVGNDRPRGGGRVGVPTQDLVQIYLIIMHIQGEGKNDHTIMISV